MCAYNDDSIPRVVSLKTTMTQLIPEGSSSSIPDSLPDLVCINSECDACPFCPDVCLDSECGRCSTKAKVLNDKCISVNNETATESGTPFAFRLFARNQKVGHNDTYTRCQLRRHCTMDSAWLLCGDVIYDATRHINGHPGGETSILRKSGGAADCTKDMKFHSERAFNMLKKNRVGVLRPCPGKDGLSPDEHFTNEENCVIS
jgi:cytochrome b involved in lipid metabolism